MLATDDPTYKADHAALARQWRGNTTRTHDRIRRKDGVPATVDSPPKRGNSGFKYAQNFDYDVQKTPRCIEARREWQLPTGSPASFEALIASMGAKGKSARAPETRDVRGPTNAMS